MNNLFPLVRSLAMGRSLKAMCLISALTLFTVALLAGTAVAIDYSDYWYCNSVEDFLDSRPVYATTALALEPLYLQWGKEQGIPGMEGEILPGNRREALYSFYKYVHETLLHDVVMAKDAPDVGVKVTVGEPHVVMFGPAGTVTDREENIARIGYERWGHYMTPRFGMLKDGTLMVSVYIGGEVVNPKAPVELVNYVSRDGGKNWMHIATYDNLPGPHSSYNNESTKWPLPTPTPARPAPKAASKPPKAKVSFETGPPVAKWWPFLPKMTSVRAGVQVFPNGTRVAFYRHNGLYWSGGGPLIMCRSTNQGRTWSKQKAIRMPGCNPIPVMLNNGICAVIYQRPGVFITFCADGNGESWGNDVTLVRAWKNQRDENSDCNGSVVVTGPDRFMFAYSKWDVPDPWGQPRLATMVQEFIVSKK